MTSRDLSKILLELKTLAATQLRLRPCVIAQVTPLLVTYDGGVSTNPGVKLDGFTYTLGGQANALSGSGITPMIFPLA